MTQNKEDNYVEGFALSGVEVREAQNKDFVIVAIPEYITFQDGDQAKRRLKMKIQFNKEIVDYYPNKTSQQKIVQAKGRNLENWVSFTGKLKTEAMRIGKEEKEVIFIE